MFQVLAHFKEKLNNQQEMKSYQWAKKKAGKILPLLADLKEPISFIAPGKAAVTDFLFEIGEPYNANGVTTRGYKRFRTEAWISDDQADKMPVVIRAYRREGYANSWTINIYPKEYDIEAAKEDKKFKEWKNKWLTPSILRCFEEQGDTSHLHMPDIKIICKFFNPSGAGTWYCYEYYPEDETMMCFANLGDPVCAELGTVSLRELASIKSIFGLGIERDRYYGFDHTLEEVYNKIKEYA